MEEAGMKRAAATCAVLALAGACAPSTPAPGPMPPRAAPVAPPTRYATPTPYVTPRPSSQPAPPPAAADACGAAAHVYLVGKNRSEIPVPVNPSQRRVYCSTCPVTMDFAAWRLNIVYNAENDLITEVRCG